VKRLALSFLPLGLGLGLALLWWSGLWANPILHLRVDLGSFSLLIGFLGSIFLWAGLALWAWAGRRCEQTLSRFQREQADAHRRFLRRLDHEIKNPLTAIRAGLANLPEQGDRDILSSVRSQIDRLARLSSDLRKLADLEVQPIEQGPVDLASLLTETVEVIGERPAAAHRLNISLPRIPWPLPPVIGDRDLLFLALHNLLDNALKFSGPQDTVEVRAFEDGNWVIVEVADTGPGIPEDELPHLGEELYRGSTARNVEGSGLGLALVRAIVARHGGRMTVRSRLGKGTVVALRLPTLQTGGQR